MRDGYDKDIELMLEAVGASDEDVASKAKMSSKTVLRARKGLVPAETRAAIIEALEALRIERNERTSASFIRRTAKTAG